MACKVRGDERGGFRQGDRQALTHPFPLPSPTNQGPLDTVYEGGTFDLDVTLPDR